MKFILTWRLQFIFQRDFNGHHFFIIDDLGNDK